ncbi:MAG: hypothetical protein OEW86_00795 [Nitrosopumilus sp.]|nr:hypothetical protein [Nitrosopumilus sp.]MDH5553580.1 hypothetical protein [Nitrosopumilus sp.]
MNARPKLTMTKRYGTRNAPPPFVPTRYGNHQMFPIPTAEPIAANKNP